MAWLLKLAVLAAGSKPRSEIEAQARVYAELLEFPAFVYSRDSLKAAAGERFKFFPAYLELNEFFREMVAGAREELRRCELMAMAVASSPAADEPWRPPTEEEKARVTELLKAHLGANWNKFELASR